MNELQGAHVLVTRPAHQAETLCQVIERHGGIPVRFPTIEIVGLENQISATNLTEKLSKFRWLIFTSANAVNFALKANDGKIREFSETGIAAIGKATAKALESVGMKVGLLPDIGFDSEALLAMPQMQYVKGQSILIIRGQGGREELASGLRNRGATVEYLDVYKRIMPQQETSQVSRLLENNELAAVVVTSGEALVNLITMLGINFQYRLKAVQLVVISDRIRRLAENIGFLRIAVTENPSDQAIFNTMIAIINGDERG